MGGGGEGEDGWVGGWIREGVRGREGGRRERGRGGKDGGMDGLDQRGEGRRKRDDRARLEITSTHRVILNPELLQCSCLHLDVAANAVSRGILSWCAEYHWPSARFC